MKYFFTAIGIGLALCLSAQHKQLCITVDDLPFVNYGKETTAEEKELTQKLVGVFKQHKIQAIGYVNEWKLYKNGALDSNRVELLKLWRNAECDLGNHTFSHFSINRVSTASYFDDILKGEKITKELLGTYGDSLKYFRHPFLHTGAEKEKADSLTQFLTAHGYQAAPVTIDNEDYLFAKAYYIASVVEDKNLMKKIGKYYVDYMEKKLVFFEQKSREVFEKEITQTLLIHASRLNCDYIQSLVKMYQKHGYEFVSQEVALKDGAYATPVTIFSRKGDSWIFRWGLSMGKPSQWMEDTIEVPDIISELNK